MDSFSFQFSFRVIVPIETVYRFNSFIKHYFIIYYIHYELDIILIICYTLFSLYIIIVSVHSLHVMFIHDTLLILAASRPSFRFV